MEQKQTNSALQVFNYEGNAITFQTGNGVMVNATEMAKTFGKFPKDFLVTKQAKELIERLSAVRRIPLTELVIVNQGGNKQGTWLHEDVALVFAQWLSPDFYIWCNDRIKELLTTGVATVADDDAAILHAMQVLQKRVEAREIELKEANTHIAIVEEINEQQERQLTEQAPKVLFADAVSTSKDSVLVSDLAKVLTQNGYETGEKRLYKELRSRGFLCVRDGYKNQPAQRYLEMGLFEIKYGNHQNPNGTSFVTKTTKVTAKGLVYFVNYFLNIKKSA